MTLDEYQAKTLATAIYPESGELAGLIYTVLKLNGEAGEIAEKVGKVMRDQKSFISAEDRSALAWELGDVLWYVSAMAKELRFPLETIARMNLDKLANRAKRNKLRGSGDNR